MVNVKWLIAVLALVSLASAANWQDPTNCPTTYLSQSCIPLKVCGVDGSNIAYCWNTPAFVAPAGSPETETTYGATGGWQVDCYAFDAANPRCDNAGAYWCGASGACSATHNKTICTGGVWLGSSCSANCMTGWESCPWWWGSCAISAGNTDCDPNDSAKHCKVQAGCGLACASGYLDCDSGGVNATNGCEVQNGGACTVSGLPGTYSGCTCVTTPQHHLTGVQANGSSTFPNLWTQQFGSGWIFNGSSTTTGNYLGINASGCLVMNSFLGDSYSCNLAGGGGTAYTAEGEYVYLLNTTFSFNQSAENITINTIASLYNETILIDAVNASFISENTTIWVVINNHSTYFGTFNTSLGSRFLELGGNNSNQNTDFKGWNVTAGTFLGLFNWTVNTTNCVSFNGSTLYLDWNCVNATYYTQWSNATALNITGANNSIVRLVNNQTIADTDLLYNEGDFFIKIRNKTAAGRAWDLVSYFGDNVYWNSTVGTFYSYSTFGSGLACFNGQCSLYADNGKTAGVGYIPTPRFTCLPSGYCGTNTTTPTEQFVVNRGNLLITNFGREMFANPNGTAIMIGSAPQSNLNPVVSLGRYDQSGYQSTAYLGTEFMQNSSGEFISFTNEPVGSGQASSVLVNNDSLRYGIATGLTAGNNFTFTFPMEVYANGNATFLGNVTAQNFIGGSTGGSVNYTVLDENYLRLNSNNSPFYNTLEGQGAEWLRATVDNASHNSTPQVPASAYPGVLTAGGTDFGMVGNLSMTYLFAAHDYRIREDGNVSGASFYLNFIKNFNFFSIDVWRKNSAGTYDQIGTSGNITFLAIGQNNVTFASPIQNVREGDFYGVTLGTIGGATEFKGRSVTAGRTYYVTYQIPAGTQGVAWETAANIPNVVAPFVLKMDAPFVVFIGDSIMAGFVSTTAGHYSFIDNRDVTNSTWSPAYRVRMALGVTAQDMSHGEHNLTLEIANRFNNDVINAKPSLLFIEGGVNDIISNKSEADFLANYTVMLDSARTNNIFAVVSGIAPANCSAMIPANYTKCDYILQWNQDLKELVEPYDNAVFVDLFPYVGCLNSTGNGYEMCAAYYDDGLHFNQLGYAQIAKAYLDHAGGMRAESFFGKDLALSNSITISNSGKPASSSSNEKLLFITHQGAVSVFEDNGFYNSYGQIIPVSSTTSDNGSKGSAEVLGDGKILRACYENGTNGVPMESPVYTSQDSVNNTWLRRASISDSPFLKLTDEGISLNILETNNTAIKIAGTTTGTSTSLGRANDVGGFLLENVDYNGTCYIARDSTASGVGLAGSTLGFYSVGGLTSGQCFTPAAKMNLFQNYAFINGTNYTQLKIGKDLTGTSTNIGRVDDIGGFFLENVDWNGTCYIAKTSAVSGLGVASAVLGLYAQSGLTAGNCFTPTPNINLYNQSVVVNTGLNVTQNLRVDMNVSADNVTIGSLTMSRQSSFRAYNSSNMAVEAALTRVNFDTEDWDTRAEYSNPRFTAKEAGIYLACVQLGCSSLAQAVTMIISKNGVTNSTKVNGARTDLNKCDFFQMSAGDYLEVYASAVAAGTCTAGTAKTSFAVFKES